MGRYFPDNVTVAGVNPWDLAVKVIVPGPVALTMARQRPLNAFIEVPLKGSRLAASPLSRATISPGPLMEKVTGFLLRGTMSPSLSSTVTVTKERSFPSAAIDARSGVSESLVAGPVVLIVSFAQGLPSLYATAFRMPGAYITSSQRRRYSEGPFFLRPSEVPLRNNSASSPEV